MEYLYVVSDRQWMFSVPGYSDSTVEEFIKSLIKPGLYDRIRKKYPRYTSHKTWSDYCKSGGYRALGGLDAPGIKSVLAILQRVNNKFISADVIYNVSLATVSKLIKLLPEENNPWDRHPIHLFVFCHERVLIPMDDVRDWETISDKLLLINEGMYVVHTVGKYIMKCISGKKFYTF